MLTGENIDFGVSFGSGQSDSLSRDCQRTIPYAQPLRFAMSSDKNDEAWYCERIVSTGAQALFPVQSMRSKSTLTNELNHCWCKPHHVRSILVASAFQNILLYGGPLPIIVASVYEIGFSPTSHRIMNVSTYSYTIPMTWKTARQFSMTQLTYSYAIFEEL
jgi:hypothetical protein